MRRVCRACRAGGRLTFVNRQKLAPVFDGKASKLAIKMGAPDNRITSLSGDNHRKALIVRVFAESRRCRF